MTDVVGSTTLIHLAGPVIRYETTQRQRCSWCGFVLVDNDLARIAVQIPEDGSPPAAPGGFEVGAFVEVTVAGGFRASSTVEAEVSAEDPEAVKVPENCCMRLPPELTGRET